MSYVPQGETVLTSTGAESDDLGTGQLVCTERRVVFEGNDGETADITLERIDGMEHYTGEGLTDDALMGLAIGLIGAIGALGGFAVPDFQSTVAGIGVLVSLVGLAIAVIYYDSTTGLRIHTPAKTWVFEGAGLKDFPNAVRAAVER